MALFLDIKVVPRSGRQKCILDKRGFIKCYLKNPPEKGLANKEVIKFFAKQLHVPQKYVELVSGLSSRNKRLKIKTDMTLDNVLQALGLARQRSLF